MTEPDPLLVTVGTILGVSACTVTSTALTSLALHHLETPNASLTTIGHRPIIAVGLAMILPTALFVPEPFEPWSVRILLAVALAATSLLLAVMHTVRMFARMMS